MLIVDVLNNLCCKKKIHMWKKKTIAISSGTGLVTDPFCLFEHKHNPKPVTVAPPI